MRLSGSMGRGLSGGQVSGPLIAANLRRRRSPPTGRWHLDEMVVRIGGQRMYLWRAVDDEGEVLDILVQKRLNKAVSLPIESLI